MQYKLLEINAVYSELFNKFKVGFDYESSKRKFLDICFAESDFIHKYFRRDLHLESDIIIYNFTSLQNIWDDCPDKDPFSILRRQIKKFQPDVIFICDMYLFSQEQLSILRADLNNRVKITGFHFALITPFINNILPFYDMLFTGSKYYAEMLRKYNSQTYVIRHAFEPAILDSIKETRSINKVCFAGSLMLDNYIHSNRLDMFSSLRKKSIPFDYYGKIYGSIKTFLRQYPLFFYDYRKYMDRISIYLYLKNRCIEPKFGIDYYDVLSKYSVNVNIHSDIAGSGAGNMRMFEVTGVGSCLVTDFRDENSELFEIDEEIVVFKNKDELTEKINFLIDHPSKAREIAIKGQKRTLNNYTYYHKAMLLDACFQKLF